MHAVCSSLPRVPSWQVASEGSPAIKSAQHFLVNSWWSAGSRMFYAMFWKGSQPLQVQSTSAVSIVLRCCVTFMTPLQRGNHFAETSTIARQTIAELGARFIRTNAVVLTHGYSRVVLALLQRAVAQVSVSGMRPLTLAVRTYMGGFSLWSWRKSMSLGPWKRAGAAGPSTPVQPHSSWPLICTGHSLHCHCDRGAARWHRAAHGEGPG
jgi:hypothetical protein